MSTYQDSSSSSERPAPPSFSEVGGNGTTKYRASKGVIATGREDSAEYRTVEGLSGYFERVYVNEGQNKTTGQPYRLLEIEIETADEGRVRFGVNTTQGTATLSFGNALLQCRKGDNLIISASEGKLNKYQKKPTYVNISVYDHRTKTKTRRSVEPDYGDVRPIEEKVNVLLDAMRGHEAWRALDLRDEEAGDYQDATSQEGSAPSRTPDQLLADAGNWQAILKGWNVPREEWQAFMAKAFKRNPNAKASDLFLLAVKDGADSLDAIEKMWTGDDEYDPFADS